MAPHMVSMFASEFRANIYKIGIYCFSAEQAALKCKSKSSWLEIRIMCPSGATWTVAWVSWYYTNTTKHVGLEQNGFHHHKHIEL